jgi:hypothetical protein
MCYITMHLMDLFIEIIICVYYNIRTPTLISNHILRVLLQSFKIYKYFHAS